MMERCINSECYRKLIKQQLLKCTRFLSAFICWPHVCSSQRGEDKTWMILQGKVNGKVMCREFQRVVYRAATSWAVRLAACLHRDSSSSLIVLFFFYSGQAMSRWSLTVQGQNKWPLNNTAIVFLLVVSVSLHLVAESFSVFLKALLKVRLFHLSSSALVSLLWCSYSFRLSIVTFSCDQSCWSWTMNFIQTRFYMIFRGTVTCCWNVEAGCCVL